ncbi:MAG TPA: PVC-type heme-binding CxxCH protein, partial [Verrucomicrobiae bacterium]|nr:PVC-type heme-binding CxxCH protein [Verrucomicrobiae bacterium]
MAEALRTFSLLPLLTTLHLVLFFTFSSAAATVNSPLQPAAALSAFQVDPGLKLELLAAEPLVVDPVAMCFDEKGRLFVAENRDYPTGPEPGQERAGTIALLEDTDGDGRFDKRTEFVSHLSFPNGVLPWDGGLIVTCAPEVLYFKDTDGDGRADVKRVLFTGFNTEGSTQLRVSHPTLGPDGWVYLTSGFSRGNKVICPEHPERPGLEFRTDCRFDPRTLEIIPEESRAQFGLTFDDFGHRFICYNRVHIQHVVFPGPYLKRNPNLAFSKTVQDVPENRVRDWLVNDEGFAARVYPISETITTYESHSGTFTAACGVHVYAGDGLPHEYYGNVFACEPTGNLVHREELVPRGATFGSHMVAEGREFLASPDTWFRPVFLTEGPDGALCICDMYRKTIEHPDYLPPETRKHTDFSSGKGMGRIWRVTRADSATNRHQNDFSHAENELLVKNLASSNGWHRVTAQRLLLERNARSAAPALKQLLTDTKAIPAGRFLALWLLNRFDALDPQNLLSAFHDPVPGLREAAIRLSEHRTTESSKLFDAMLKTSGDPDPRVRFQSALSFGEAALSSNGLTALEVIAMRDS